MKEGLDEPVVSLMTGNGLGGTASVSNLDDVPDLSNRRVRVLQYACRGGNCTKGLPSDEVWCNAR